MVKVRELTVDGASILMEGETISFDAVERLKQTLASSSQLKDVAVTETRVGAGPNQVVFRMAVTVEKS
jgi:general secretion pathway protein L